MPSASRLVFALALFGSARAVPAQTHTYPEASAARVVRSAAALVREAAALRSDPLAPFRQFVGDWTGTLTYTDYGDDSTRVELGVRITVAERRDSLDTPALELRYAYTEPDGRAVDGGQDLLVPGADPARLTFGDMWDVVERDTTGGRLRLVFVQQGEDNGRPATIRETLTAGADAWTLRKEVRYTGTDAFFERHTYTLRRAE